MARALPKKSEASECGPGMSAVAFGPPWIVMTLPGPVAGGNLTPEGDVVAEGTVVGDGPVGTRAGTGRAGSTAPACQTGGTEHPNGYG
jgi:hypothetical protein